MVGLSDLKARDPKGTFDDGFVHVLFVLYHHPPIDLQNGGDQIKLFSDEI